MRVKRLAGIVLILTHAHSGMDVDERAERDDSLLLLSARRPCCLLIISTSRLFHPNRRPKSPVMLLISFISIPKVQGILSQITGIKRLFYVPFESMESHQANGTLRLAEQAVGAASPAAGKHC